MIKYHLFIIKALRPRAALPAFFFGLERQCDHVSGSKWLPKELLKLAFSISHSEANRLKKSVAMSTPFPENSVLKEIDKISPGKDISSIVSVTNKTKEQQYEFINRNKTSYSTSIPSYFTM